MIQIGINIVFAFFGAWLLMFLIKTYYDKKPTYWSTLLAIALNYLISYVLGFALAPFLGEKPSFFLLILLIIITMAACVLNFKYVIQFPSGGRLSTGQAFIMLIIYIVSGSFVILGVSFVIGATKLVSF